MMTSGAAAAVCVGGLAIKRYNARSNEVAASNVQSASSVWPVVLPDGTFADSVSCGAG